MNLNALSDPSQVRRVISKSTYASDSARGNQSDRKSYER